MSSPGFVRQKISKGYSPNLLPSIARRRLERIAQARGPAAPSIEEHWRPNPGPQEQFFNSDCREILYGGSAGGGKSAALTALLLKYSHLPGFNGVVFRRESGQFRDLIVKSEALFPRVYPGLTPVYSPHFKWTFPAGGTAHYRHLQHEKDARAYDGWEINFLGFDELTHFLESQYLALLARVRSSDPRLPRIIRSTTNPGGPGHDWVFRRWGAWLDPEFDAQGLGRRVSDDGAPAPPALPGEVLWVRTLDDGTERFYRERPPDEPGLPPALSRTFIPAKLSDNPHLAQNDPEYVAALNSLDPVRRAQLKEGDWLVKPAAGLLFKRSWVQFVDAVPAGALRVRYWDLAATEDSSDANPDWTVGVLLAKVDDLVFIEDVIRVRSNPGEVERLIINTAEADGPSVFVGLPQDPGQAGKFQASHLVKRLEGFTTLVEIESGDKVTRFGPFSAQAEHGNVRIVRGAWNKAYIEELEAFPTKGVKDDQVDATSGAYKRAVGDLFNLVGAMNALQEGAKIFG